MPVSLLASVRVAKSLAVHEERKSCIKIIDFEHQKGTGIADGCLIGKKVTPASVLLQLHEQMRVKNHVSRLVAESFALRSSKKPQYDVVISERKLPKIFYKVNDSWVARTRRKSLPEPPVAPLPVTIPTVRNIPKRFSTTAVTRSASPDDDTNQRFRKKLIPEHGDWGLQYYNLDLHLKKKKTQGSLLQTRQAVQLHNAQQQRQADECRTALESFAEKHVKSIDVANYEARCQHAVAGLSKVTMRFNRTRAKCINPLRDTPYSKLWASFTPSEVQSLYTKFAGDVKYSMTPAAWISLHKEVEKRDPTAFQKTVGDDPLLLEKLYMSLDSSRDNKISFVELVSFVALLTTSATTQSTLRVMFDKLNLFNTSVVRIPSDDLFKLISPSIEKDQIPRWESIVDSFSDNMKLEIDSSNPSWTYDSFLAALFAASGVPLEVRFQGLILTR